jgi:3,4-dihydroxy 2-butanone 4-phosphate synthase / GTP cyclohydrolase II
MGAQMLNDLGITKIRLITNNPRKIAGLKGYGIEIVDRVPLLIEANPYNCFYLDTKAQKLGHMLLQTYLATVAIFWDDEPSRPERYNRLEKMRSHAVDHHLLMREEARPVILPLFGKPSVAVHFGLDQAGMAAADWYKQKNHPYLQSLAQILDKISQLPQVARMEFLISTGGNDPLIHLTADLDRQNYSLLKQLPSSVCEQLETQIIYNFSQDHSL